MEICLYENEGNAALTYEGLLEQIRAKLKSLLVMAKKKKNMLDYQEVSAHFSDLNLEEEQFDKIIETLEQNNVDIVRMSDDDDDIVDEDIMISVEDEPDVENIDLSVPANFSQNIW